MNLAVTMSAALLRPDLPVIARTVSPAIAQRMESFGSPSVINPFDRFGDHLRVALRAPASYQLMTWLEGGPGARLPARGQPPQGGRWVVCGYGRFGRELTADLHREDLDVTIIDPTADPAAGASVVVGDAADPDVLLRAGLPDAVGFVAGTDNDTTNLSLVAAARRIKPGLFVATRQNAPASAPLFAAMDVDSLLVPTELVAHEVYAQLSTPLLWRFLQELPAQGDAWAADVVERLVRSCGAHLEALWTVRLDEDEAPALQPWLALGDAVLGDLLRNPDRREDRLPAVPLLVLRSGRCLLTPADDVALEPGDELLLAGSPSCSRALETTLMVDAAREYVRTGRHVPSSWVWRQLSTSGRGGRR